MMKRLDQFDINKSETSEFVDLEVPRSNKTLNTTVFNPAIQRALDDLVELACLVCEVRVCLITFIDDEKQWIKSAKGTQVNEISRQFSFCQQTILQGSVFEIADVGFDSKFEGNDLLREQPSLRFYAGYPLIDAAGYAFGTVCVLDDKKQALSLPQSRSLQLIASQVIALIAGEKKHDPGQPQHRNYLKDRFRKDETSSEEKLRSFFENSQGLMCTHDLDGNFTAVNSVGAGLLGYTVDQILKMSLRDVTPVKHLRGLGAYLHQIRHTGKSTGLMTTMHKDGHHVIWSYRNSLVREANGQDYVVGNCIDITQSYKQGKELRRTQQVLAQTNLIAGVGGWEYSLPEREFYFSELARQICRLGPEFNLDSQSALSFFKTGDSRDRVVKAMADSIAHGTPHTIEVQIVTSNSEDRWVRVVVNAEMESGQCKKLYGIVQDIDENKITEIQIGHAKEQLRVQQARLLAFVEHIPAVVAMLDTDIRYLVVSRKWEEEYGLTGKEIIGKRYDEAFVNLGKHWKDIYQQALSGKGVQKGEEVFRPQGWEHDKYLSWEVWPWYQFDGSIGGIITLIHDVTEMELHGQELRKAREQAEQASMAKSEFLANMSHEIRTPLNGVIGFTDLMLKTDMSDTQKQYLGIVNQSAHTLLSIINDILDFSKIEAGKLELDIDRYDIYEIAAQTADIISFQVQSKGLEMLVDIPSCLPRFVWVDDIRLKQILINLLSNAAKFTENGEIELKIQILQDEPQEENTITCRFIVRDTGIGIREEKKVKIFEAFLQEDGSTTKKYGGTGLGLTISNQLLALMGSSLQLESVQGVGSTLFFDLKMKCEKEDCSELPALTSIRKVLVVDDNAKSRRLLTRMLGQLGVTARQAANGQQALQVLAQQESYDAVLVDYHMPDMDGLETIRQMQKTYSSEQFPIVLMSTTADDALVINACKNLGINSRLMKPIKLANISALLLELTHKEVRLRPAKPSLPSQALTRDIRVLVVEDHLINMLLAKTLIKKSAVNATILEATNGREALEECQKQLPDLIFMDIQMPVMNGYEATSMIRQLPGADKVPIIALTAGNVMGEKERCMDAGMDDFISKPFVQDAISQVFKKFLAISE